MISCQVCWRTMRWHNGLIRRSPNPNPEEVFHDCITKWEESVAHSILARRTFLQQRPYTFAQTNPVILLFACNQAADHTFRIDDNVSESYPPGCITR